MGLTRIGVPVAPDDAPEEELKEEFPNKKMTLGIANEIHLFDMEPFDVTETREEFNKRLAGEHPRMRDYSWNWNQYMSEISKLTPEERKKSLDTYGHWIFD